MASKYTTQPDASRHRPVRASLDSVSASHLGDHPCTTPSTLQNSSPSASSSDPFTPMSRHDPTRPLVSRIDSRQMLPLPLFSHKSLARHVNRGPTLDATHITPGDPTSSPSSSSRAFPSNHLPTHLRKPSLPPPTGPLPRTPSHLENEQIGALLLAPSPNLPNTTPLQPPTFNFPPNTAASQPARLRSDDLAPQLQSESTSSSLVRRPSSHTQASSDALGEALGSYPQSNALLPVTLPNGHSSSSSAGSGNRANVESSSISGSNLPTPEKDSLVRNDQGAGVLYGAEAVGRTLGRERDSTIKIHPADDRFEYTYRVRQATDDEEPVLVPVYSFEPPGKFPERTRLTSPRTMPGLINHTPRNFSLPRRLSRKIVRRSSSESIEMLLPIQAHQDSFDVVAVPPIAYHRNARSPIIQQKGQTAPSAHQQYGFPLKPADAPPAVGPNNTEPRTETAMETFERRHIHYFQDLDNLEKANTPNKLIAPEIQIHGPRNSFSKYHGPPTLRQVSDAYTGMKIDKNRWPERHKRQGRIGKSLLFVCTFMPPLWLVMAAGHLDNFVNEMTGGEIWGVGRREKAIAAWLGGLAGCCLLIVIITVGILVK